MPYGYYMLVRFVSMVAFGVIAYRFYTQSKVALTITFASLALLFQPFIKIALGRTIWNIVDVIVVVLLIIVWIKERKWVLLLAIKPFLHLFYWGMVEYPPIMYKFANNIENLVSRRMTYLNLFHKEAAERKMRKITESRKSPMNSVDAANYMKRNLELAKTMWTLLKSNKGRRNNSQKQMDCGFPLKTWKGCREVAFFLSYPFFAKLNFRLS